MFKGSTSQLWEWNWNNVPESLDEFQEIDTEKHSHKQALFGRLTVSQESH